MKKFLALLLSVSLLPISTVSAQAAEGGYSNYIPGTYGDFAAVIEPTSKLTIRNDLYYYQDDAAILGEFKAEAAGVGAALLWNPK